MDRKVAMGPLLYILILESKKRILLYGCWRFLDGFSFMRLLLEVYGIPESGLLILGEVSVINNIVSGASSRVGRPFCFIYYKQVKILFC